MKRPFFSPLVLLLPLISSSSAFLLPTAPAPTHTHHPATIIPTTNRLQRLSASSDDQASGGIFKLIRSDALSLTVGSLCLLALVTNRLYTDPLFDSQSRTDILGVFSAGGLLLNGLTLQDITVREADTIELQGARVDEVVDDGNLLTPRQATVLRWAADTYLQAFSSTDSVLIWHKGRTLLRKGIMNGSDQGKTEVEIKAIVTKALTMTPDDDGLSQPTYIPDLQVLPGKVEFVDYLPTLCQAVVLQPFDDNQGLVVLGGNKRRDLTPKDLAKVRVVAQKVQSCLREG